MIPDQQPPPDFDQTRSALDAARAQRDATAATLRSAEQARAAAQALSAELERREAELNTAVAGNPGSGETDRLLHAIGEAETAAERARGAERKQRAAADAAQKGLDAAENAERAARRQFDAARDRASDLSPPPAERSDLSADWLALERWASERVPAEQQAASDATRQSQQAREQLAALREALIGQCDALDVERADGEAPSSAALRALAAQEALVERIEAALEQIRQVTQDRKQAQDEQAVAVTLGRHLSSSGFEKWLLDEALHELIAGATQILLALSNGAYSLVMDAKSNTFWVIDHRNADERRPARTLSGGETFLASLALALSLSERLADLASEGARLDAIFLDEGFGTLDAETLETVASAIETLAAAGRMVGLVTHVPQIAEQVPIRFEVRKDPDTSRVEKVYV